MKLKHLVPWFVVAYMTLIMSIDQGYKTEYLTYSLLVVGFILIWDMWRKTE